MSSSGSINSQCPLSRSPHKTSITLPPLDDMSSNIIKGPFDNLAQEVTGLHGRKKLTKAGSGDTSDWMDVQRQNLQAYEYLCHVGEAKEWMEAILNQDLGDTIHLEESLRNGISLAKLAKHFEPELVKKIFEGETLQYRHSDNIVFFLAALRKLGLPEVFYFETVDLYEKKNVPKVLYCIHALGHYLYKKGLAPAFRNLVGKLNFSEIDLEAKQKQLEGVALPSFGNVADTLQQHLETEEEKRTRLWQDKTDVILGLQSLVSRTLQKAKLRKLIKEVKEHEETFLKFQCVCRSYLNRRKLHKRREYYKEKEESVKKIQAFMKSRIARKAYKELKEDVNPSFQTVGGFIQLLDKDGTDLDDELEIESLRQQVVKQIHENSKKEEKLAVLDVKIALLVKNRISVEDVVSDNSPKEGLLQSFKSFDKENQTKIKAYQELFYLLQTNSQYISRLIFSMKSSKVKHFVDSIALALFGYAQNSREEYLLLKLLEDSFRAELATVSDAQEFLRGNPIFIRLLVIFIRGAREREFLCDLLSPLVKPVMEDKDCRLETDPLVIYHEMIKEQESETGEKSQLPYEVTRDEALKHEHVRKSYDANLKKLTDYSSKFLHGIIANVDKMPFGIRHIAKVMYSALKAKFTNESDESILKVVGNLIYYRYMNPAIVAPEGFDVMNSLISAQDRKNLAEISKILQYVSTNKEFKDDYPYLKPLNEYIQKSSQEFFDYVRKVAQVPPLEEHFEVDEYKDLTETQKPVIYISAYEILSTHQALMENLDTVAPTIDDPLRQVLDELGQCPPISEDMKREGPELSLILSSRLHRKDNQDMDAETRKLFLSTKKGILSLMRLVKGKTIADLLKTPITASLDEMYDKSQVDTRTADPAASVENIFSPSSPSELSLSALQHKLSDDLNALEAKGIVSRNDGYQKIINVIAKDIRTQNKRRLQRQKELSTLRKTLKNLNEKESYLDQQTQSYNDYIQSCMAQLAAKNGKKKFKAKPFTRQYAHLKKLQKAGQMPKFGSYKYTAEHLHKKGVLISIDDVSPKQFDKITMTISSDEPGIFQVQASLLGIKEIQSAEIKLDDLLQLQFDNVQIMTLLDMAKVNVNLLIFLINKKFYQ